MNINSQLGLMTHPIPVYKNSVDQQLGFIGSDGQGMMFNADGGEYWASKATPNYSDDNLIMLNEDNSFLNAGGLIGGDGSGGNSKVDAETRMSTSATKQTYDSWNTDISAYKITDNEPLARVKGTYVNSVSGKNNLYLFLTELNFLKSGYDKGLSDLNNDLSKYPVSKVGAQTKAGSDYNNRRAVNEKIWIIQSKVNRLEEIIKSVEKQIEDAKVKADNDAFAQAKSTNTIASYSDYLNRFPQGLSVEKAAKAIDDLKKAQTIKELEERKKTATPEEKKRIDAEINNLLGNVTTELKGTGGKILLYGGVALVGAFLLYRVFRSNPTSA
jgi:hypothetical protein